MLTSTISDFSQPGASTYVFYLKFLAAYSVGFAAGFYLAKRIFGREIARLTAKLVESRQYHLQELKASDRRQRCHGQVIC